VLLANLPAHSRLWFFGAHRILSEHEIEVLNQAMSAFVYSIQHEAILIVGVDESVAPPTGCSIDKVFQLLKDFQSQTGVDFFQRTLIWEAFCNTTEIYTIDTAKQALESGRLKSNTLILNPLITQLIQARESMYIPLNESWAAPKLGVI
jgi:hypothetical protein